MNYNPERYHNNLAPTDKLSWIGVDLDNCLAEQIWPRLGIGRPIPQTVDLVRRLHSEGDKIIVHTSRSWAEYKDIELWLRDHDIPFREIQCGKPLYKAYIDDKAYKPEWLDNNFKVL